MIHDPVFLLFVQMSLNLTALFHNCINLILPPWTMNVSRHYPFDIEILVSQITYTSFPFYDTVIYLTLTAIILIIESVFLSVLCEMHHMNQF